MPRSRARVTTFSVGYEGRKVDALGDALEAAGVSVLLDVRARAWSHRPEFRKTALATALESRGIDYVHCKLAGNPYRAASKKPNGWVACERKYREYVRDNDAILQAVEQQVLRGGVALFCYEAERSFCHRGVLLGELRRRLGTLVVKDL